MEVSNYWLIIEPYVHIEITRSEVLLYNTLNNKSELFTDTFSYRLFKDMEDLNKLRVISIKEDLIVSSEIKFVLKRVMENFMGDIRVTKKSCLKPVQLAPLLRVEELQKNSSIFSKKFSSFVTEFSFFINDNKVTYDHNFFKFVNKQHLTVKRNSDDYVELDFELIKKFTSLFSPHCLSEVNITGSNIFEHSSVSELIEFLNRHLFWKNYHIGFRDFSIKYLTYLNRLDDKSNLSISFCNFNEEEELIYDIIQSTKLIPNIKYDFFVCSNDCIKIVEGLYSSLNFSNNNRLLPYFDGNNLSFINDSLSFFKGDIFESRINMKDILLKQKFNLLQFGKLLLDCDGSLYSSLDSQSLGNVSENSILKMINKEINLANNWSILRNDVKPCCDCVYKNLCPPISNIELFLKKFNFCNLYN